MNFKIDGLQVHQEAERAVVYRLSDGEILSVTNPPALARTHSEWTQDENEAMGIVRGALNALAALERQRREVEADATLSALGKQEKLKPALSTAHAAVSKAEANLKLLDNTVSYVEGEAMALPQLEPGDAVSAMQDMEIRQSLRSASHKERPELFQLIAANPRLQEAVLRSPIPMPVFGDIAEKSRTERVRKEHPNMPRITRGRESLDWAKSLLPAIAARLR